MGKILCGRVSAGDTSVLICYHHHHSRGERYTQTASLAADVDLQALGSSIPIGARSLLYIAMAFGCGLRGIPDQVLLAVERLCSRVFDKTSLDCKYLMKTPYELVEVSQGM